jgi:hypothetical protein
MVQPSVTRCSCIAILWVSLVSFAAIIVSVASQRVIPKVRVYFVMDSVRKLLNISSYVCIWRNPQNTPVSIPGALSGVRSQYLLSTSQMYQQLANLLHKMSISQDHLLHNTLTGLAFYVRCISLIQMIFTICYVQILVRNFCFEVISVEGVWRFPLNPNCF